MTIYDTVNERLENKAIDSADIAAIGFTPSIGRYVQLDDGTRIAVSDHDYWLLDDNLEAMHRYWRSMQTDIEVDAEMLVA